MQSIKFPSSVAITVDGMSSRLAWCALQISIYIQTWWIAELIVEMIPLDTHVIYI